MEAKTKAPRRRTQAERRATTRAALLDATIDCLVEYGYAGTTTVRIVERAGVSRGAQVHHYATKAELVSDAVRHLATKRANEFLEEFADGIPKGRKRTEALLDKVWAMHTSRLFAASMELFVAARTDPELRSRLVEVERDVSQTISAGLVGLFPDRAGDRAFRESIDADLAAMRGLAILGFVYPDKEIDKRWRALRRRLLNLRGSERSAPS
jgi:AcrR family transcriptional regulator